MKIFLEDTVNWMKSTDYQDRLKAEYWQVRIRYKRLHEYLILVELGFETVESKKELELLEKQAKIMKEYQEVLEARAELMGMNLNASE